MDRHSRRSPFAREPNAWRTPVIASVIALLASIAWWAMSPRSPGSYVQAPAVALTRVSCSGARCYCTTTVRYSFAGTEHTLSSDRDYVRSGSAGEAQCPTRSSPTTVYVSPDHRFSARLTRPTEGDTTMPMVAMAFCAMALGFALLMHRSETRAALARSYED